VIHHTRRRTSPPQNRRIKILKNYKELKVWKRSYELYEEKYFEKISGLEVSRIRAIRHKTGG
jgi:hypothetical protein